MSDPIPLFDAFDQRTAELCAAFDKPCTNERRAAYRSSLGKLGEIAWARLVEHAIGEDGPDKLPSTRECWQLHRKLRAQVRPTVASTFVQPEWRGSESLRVVNQLFLRWLTREAMSGRRQAVNGRSIPEAELLQRRRVCQDLAAEHDGFLLSGDPAATWEWLEHAFNVHMDRIAVSNPRQEQAHERHG